MMSESDSTFTFVDDPAAFRDAAALVVRIPTKARGKEKVLGILSERLRFPRYFGQNWDALEECLGDLSWLGETMRVTIVHEGLPFSPAGDQLATYLAVLRDSATARNSAETGPKLEIVFAEKQRATVL
jgi:hypothetical protein